MRRAGFLVATVSVFAIAMLDTLSPREPARFELGPSAAPAVSEPFHETRDASSGRTPSVHSATAVELENGRLLAFWYGGSREGAKDVAVLSASFDGESWSPERVVATRAGTARGLRRYVKKLGNPVVGRDRRGRLWLFYVTVSVGGWSGASVTFRTSDDEGASWSSPRRLITSPFLNISTLVRGPVVSYEDGTQALPVYHELLGKFSELLRLSADGRVLDKVRLSHGRSSLQPVVVPYEPQRAAAFLRSSGASPRRVLRTETRDGGAQWTAVRATRLANPDASVATLRLSTGEWLIAFNDSEADRSNLTLGLSSDAGASWDLVRVLDAPDEPVGPPRFAYPWLLEAADGTLHLLYTWDRSRIIHERFNRDWLTAHR